MSSPLQHILVYLIYCSIVCYNNSRLRAAQSPDLCFFDALNETCETGRSLVDGSGVWSLGAWSLGIEGLALFRG